MTTQELELQILDMIEEIYCAEYTGTLIVKEIQSSFDKEVIGYVLRLGLNNTDKPLTIATDCSAEEFLIFIEKELRQKGLNRTKYFTGYKIYDNDDEE